jgi:hypothetical protein
MIAEEMMSVAALIYTRTAIIRNIVGSTFYTGILSKEYPSKSNSFSDGPTPPCC